MLKEFLEAGKITGTHGVRGEMRAQCWCDSPEFLCGFKALYFDEGKIKLNVKARPHKHMVLIKIQGVDTIEQADEYKGRVFYIRRSDVQLDDGANFIQDIIGLSVVDSESGEIYGTVTDVFNTGANDVYEMKNEDGKAYYIPVIDEIIDSIDVNSGVVKITPMKGLFDDED